MSEKALPATATEFVGHSRPCIVAKCKGEKDCPDFRLTSCADCDTEWACYRRLYKLDPITQRYYEVRSEIVPIQ